MLEAAPSLLPRFNVAPTQSVAAIRQTDQRRELVLLRWGLVPAWAKDIAIGNKMINARAETVAEKPAFRSAFKRRRCLILTDGYYEWQKTGTQKQPYHIHMRDGRPFVFAGLWERWQEPTQSQAVETCTIITTAANEQTTPIHDRMPVILNAGASDLWLDESVEDRGKLEPLLVPYAADDLVFDRISTHVNNPRNEGPSCLALV